MYLTINVQATIKRSAEGCTKSKSGKHGKFGDTGFRNLNIFRFHMGRDQMSSEEVNISYWHVTTVLNALWKTLILYQVLKKIVKFGHKMKDDSATGNEVFAVHINPMRLSSLFSMLKDASIEPSKKTYKVNF